MESSPGTPRFHTPEPPAPSNTPATNARNSNESEKGIISGLFGFVRQTLTPSRSNKPNKRSRDSRDGIDDSAIKLANGGGGIPSSGMRSAGSSGSGGSDRQVKESGNQLSKLNLEKSAFGGDGNSRQPKRMRTGGGDVSFGAGVGTSVANGGVAATAAGRATNGGSDLDSAVNERNYKVRIGGASSFTSPPAGRVASFAIGVNHTPTNVKAGGFLRKGTPGLRKFPRRVGTPARGLLGTDTSAGSSNETANNAASRKSNNNENIAMTIRPSALKPSRAIRPFRSMGSTRRAINAQKYRPMSRILTGNSSLQQHKQGASASMPLIAQATADKILKERQGTLFANAGASARTMALFGGKDNNATFQEMDDEYTPVSKAPRVVMRMRRVMGTNQTGGRRYVDGIDASGSVGARIGEHASSSKANSAVQREHTNHANAETSFETLKALDGVVSATSSSSGVLSQKKSVSFTPLRHGDSTKKDDHSDEEMDKVATVPSVPYTAKTLPSLVEGEFTLTPCQPVQEQLSSSLGECLAKKIKCGELLKKAQKPLDEDITAPGALKTPCNKVVKSQTSVTKSTSSTYVGSSSTATPSSGAPFSFMPGGAAASSKISTPKAFKFGGSTPAPGSTKPSTTSTPKSSSASTDKANAPAPAASGWGNMFQSKLGEWKCETCMVKNPKDKLKCVSCETPKPGSDGKSNNSSSLTEITPASSGWGNIFQSKPGEWKCETCMVKNPKDKLKCVSCETPKPGSDSKPSNAASERSKSNAPTLAGSIGSSGFTFGGSNSNVPAPASSSSSVGPLYGGSASTSRDDNGKAPSAKKDTVATPGISFDTKTSTMNDKKDSASSSGFNFGSPAAPSITNNYSAGFTFGTSTATLGKENSSFTSGAKQTSDQKPCSEPTDLPKPKRGRDDDGTIHDSSKKGGFSFGGDDASTREKGSTSASGFNFGHAPAASLSGTGFSFGTKEASLAAEKKDTSKAAGFSFGAGNTVPTSAASSSGTVFSLGSSNSAPLPTEKSESVDSTSKATFSNVAKPSDGNASGGVQSSFAFGNNSAPSKPVESAGRKPLSFGSAPLPSQPAETPAPKVSFGSASMPNNTASKPFTFGNATPAAATEANKPAEDANNATFSFSSAPVQSQPADGAPSQPFSFGSNLAPASNAPSTNPIFAFGSAKTAAPPAAASSSNPSFTFGQSQPPSAPSTTAPAAFSFGGATAPAAATPASAPGSGFMFGAGGNTMAPAPAVGAPAFGFGASAPTPGFAPAAPPQQGFGGNAPHPTAPPAPSFGFGSTAAPATTTASFGSGGFGMNPASTMPAGAPGGFTIGAGDNASKKGRRIIKARRPPKQS
eukprot:CAMPEP_0171330500 /NCGR_PEP_ID=MMETSP0878-20121228/2044_1 /TAXON_ID=67004 /ORGANISM="Thalassiosira weissflogii, Strain CCMP1336" /LENGTH=1338 /DNA_ID=CAMNT_0011830807 /DNA_START=268 /DNA_END=4284 /DNA_ORIENTATION=+